MAEHIKIYPAQGTWTVRAGGAVIGETSGALELSEGSMTPVIYFPRADLAMAFLEPTEQTTHCPHKGDAAYFSIVTKSRTIENAAWSYPSPNDGVAQIKDYIAFYTNTDLITVEQV